MNASTGSADEEDAAERAFTKVCRAIERGRLKLEHRVDLHKILRTATTREVLNLHYQSKRRSGTTSDEFVLSQIPDSSLTAETVLLALDACQRLLSLLEGDALRRVALWKLAGWTNEAIRLKLGCSWRPSSAPWRGSARRGSASGPMPCRAAARRSPARARPRPRARTSSTSSAMTDLDEEATGRILGGLANFR